MIVDACCQNLVLGGAGVTLSLSFCRDKIHRGIGLGGVN